MKTRKNGFTLIELLAVIVILAIIALIATPIILDVIETAKKGAKESSALGYIDAVEKHIALSKVDKTKTDLADGSYLTDDLNSTYGVSVKGEKPVENSGSWVLIENGAVKDYSLKIGDYVINYDSNKKSAKASDDNTVLTQPAGPVVVAKKYTIVNDANSDGLADIGDEIQVNGENFYVISNDGTTINALAKYNLNVGSNKVATAAEGKQSSLATGWVSGGTSPYPGAVAFSNTKGWAYSNNDDIDIQSYDGPVKTALNNYKLVITDATDVRLITKTELEGLGCSSSSSSSHSCSGAPSWVYSSTYWSGSADSFDKSYVWDVDSLGSMSGDFFDRDLYYGVRPVIVLES